MTSKRSWYTRCATTTATAVVLGALAVSPVTFAQGDTGGGMMGNAAQTVGAQSDQSSSSQASGQTGNEGNYGYGPGMMGGGYGHGPGMMWGQGYGMGPGYGPGMMWGGYGHGPGMMYGYGPGMMWDDYGFGMMPGYGPGAMGGGYWHGPGMMYGYGPGRTWGHWSGWAGLDLTADQQEKIEQLQQTHLQKQQPLYTELYQAMTQLHELMATEEPDADAVGKAFDQVSEIHKKLLLDRVRMRDQIKQVLTPDQRKALKEREQRWQGDYDQDGD